MLKKEVGNKFKAMLWCLPGGTEESQDKLPSPYGRYDMIYLTAIGLTPGDTRTVHMYTQTIHRTTQSTQAIHRTTQSTQTIHRTIQFTN